jgi:predicted Zn-dependent protease
MGMVYKGRVLARQGQWAEARKWFVKANRANPDYALPLVLYYDSFMRSNQAPTPAAVKGLLRAIVLVPQDDSLRLRVGYALLRQGDLATARAVLAPIAFSAHARPDNPALLVVRKLDEGAGAKAALAEADKAKWNEIGKE